MLNQLIYRGFVATHPVKCAACETNIDINHWAGFIMVDGLRLNIHDEPTCRARIEVRLGLRPPCFLSSISPSYINM